MVRLGAGRLILVPCRRSSSLCNLSPSSAPPTALALASGIAVSILHVLIILGPGARCPWLLAGLDLLLGGCCCIFCFALRFSLLLWLLLLRLFCLGLCFRLWRAFCCCLGSTLKSLARMVKALWYVAIQYNNTIQIRALASCFTAFCFRASAFRALCWRKTCNSAAIPSSLSCLWRDGGSETAFSGRICFASGSL